MYIGGAVDEADRMVATGKVKRDDFKFMLHLCGWAPGQLEAEIERGVWLSVATSTNVSQQRTRLDSSNVLLRSSMGPQQIAVVS